MQSGVSCISTKIMPTSSNAQHRNEQIPVAGGDCPHALWQAQSAFMNKSRTRITWRRMFRTRLSTKCPSRTVTITYCRGHSSAGGHESVPARARALARAAHAEPRRPPAGAPPVAAAAAAHWQAAGRHFRVSRVADVGRSPDDPGRAAHATRDARTAQAAEPSRSESSAPARP